MARVVSRFAALCMAASIAALMSAAPVAAQPGSGGGWGGWGPGMMMGPGMMGPGGMWSGGMCSPRAAGLAEWRIARIEQMVRPTAEQRPALDALKDASEKAAKIVAAACPLEVPQSPVDRLGVMETRMTAMLEAIKVVRPAFDTFYKALTPEQQARLNFAGPRGWGWGRWRQQQRGKSQY